MLFVVDDDNDIWTNIDFQFDKAKQSNDDDDDRDPFLVLEWIVVLHNGTNIHSICSNIQITESK